MSDTPLDMLVVRDMPDGTFAVADALLDLRLVQDGFPSAISEQALTDPATKRMGRKGGARGRRS